MFKTKRMNFTSILCEVQFISCTFVSHIYGTFLSNDFCQYILNIFLFLTVTNDIKCHKFILLTTQLAVKKSGK